MFKIGDKIVPITSDSILDTGYIYTVDRINNNGLIALAYEDGYVPHNLRGRYYNISKFKLVPKNPFKKNDVVRVRNILNDTNGTLEFDIRRNIIKINETFRVRMIENSDVFIYSEKNNRTYRAPFDVFTLAAPKFKIPEYL